MPTVVISYGNKREENEQMKIKSTDAPICLNAANTMQNTSATNEREIM